MFLRSVALYGLLLFYGLTKDELVGRKPLSKFLSIKLIVMFTFYQAFVVRPPAGASHSSDAVIDTPFNHSSARWKDTQSHSQSTGRRRTSRMV